MTITKIQNNLHNLLPLCMVLAISFFFVSKINAQVCGNTFNLETLRRTNSNVYQEHIRIEKIIVDYQKLLINNANARLINDNGVITIPVVFHILHKGEPVGTGTNISDAQIISQMAVLNQCYSQTNDQSAIPQVFRNKAGNPNFQFELACTDPNGYATNGILRRSSSTNFQKYSENIKHTNLGGDDAWQTDRFLNIWVASNLDEDLVSRPLAYATYPEFLVSKPNEDGIVINII